MTEAERARWQRYVDALRPLLRLADWTIEVSDKPCDDDASAQIKPVDDRRLAVLGLCDDFAERDPAEQRHTIVHELLHLHHHAANDVVRRDIVKHLAQSTYDVIWDGYRRHVEYATDALTDAVAPFMPLPDALAGSSRLRDGDAVSTLD